MIANFGRAGGGVVKKAPVASRSTGNIPARTPVTPGRATAQKAFASLLGQARNLLGSSTPAKTGPRGTTLADVQRIAAEGIPGWRPGMPVPTVRPSTVAPAPAPLNEAAILSGMIGGQAPTYGEKYGGQPSATYFASQVKGEAYNALMAGQRAAEEAARLGEPFDLAYARETDVTNPASAAGKTLKEAESVMAVPLKDLAARMARGKVSDQDMYGAAMARMNAVRGTGDYLTEGGATPTIREQMRSNAVGSVEPAARAARAAGLASSGAAQYQQLADLVGGLSPSELMQQIAVKRYGYDPGLAAGLFPMTEDLKYQNMLNDAYNAQIMRDYGFDPSATVAEMILQTQGPEALMQWQEQKANEALYGSPSEILAADKAMLDAENALIDQEARTNYGFDPKKVPIAEPEYVRNLLTDPAFVNSLTEARNAIFAENQDPLEVSSRIAAQYADETGNILGSRVIGEIIASFDLSYFG